jgi:hypothetical protein
LESISPLRTKHRSEEPWRWRRYVLRNIGSNWNHTVQRVRRHFSSITGDSESSTLNMEAICSSETSALTSISRRTTHNNFFKQKVSRVFDCTRQESCLVQTHIHKTEKIDSVALSPQAKYTDWATATCRRNLVPTFVDRGVSRGQRDGSPTVVIVSFLDRSQYFSFKYLLSTLTRAERTPFQTHCSS